jgi:hypothetical protein
MITAFLNSGLKRRNILSSGKQGGVEAARAFLENKFFKISILNFFFKKTYCGMELRL